MNLRLGITILQTLLKTSSDFVWWSHVASGAYDQFSAPELVSDSSLLTSLNTISTESWATIRRCHWNLLTSDEHCFWMYSDVEVPRKIYLPRRQALEDLESLPRNLD